MALSEASQAGRLVSHTLTMIAWSEGGRKGPKPEEIPAPPYAHEKRAEREQADRQAAAHKRRQANRKN
ncbi:hypothetical protein [Mycetocola tolaasinivorans]|nr:hypothetical protein [Mycetocola tolaasinivorans]